MSYEGFLDYGPDDWLEMAYEDQQAPPVETIYEEDLYDPDKSSYYDGDIGVGADGPDSPAEPGDANGEV